ncbi:MULTISPECIES: YeiH family protein [Sphingobacterium]|uniref:Sulfate exporter family transporter n=2 Tax=Sphingobacterium TaxID=28453 RepID=A0ABP7ZSY7_9SPHI|nr:MULTISPECIES: putative sulfate exporter family transporter [Sphingobacterium]MCS4229236.1 putative integral membrane protein (TIGR00698 family) [Sphingobacterium sp. BIGb0165]
MYKKVTPTMRYKHILNKKITIREIIFILLLILCLTPVVSAPLALLLGIIVAQWIGHPFLAVNHKATQILLQLSVVGLGFGMQIDSAIQTGKDGFLLTVISIIGTLSLGYVLGKLLKLEKLTAYLITVGTAICGGSAIAAVSPTVKANEKQISVALGTIFVLNALALFVFPVIGRALDLSQTQFGLWCAVAIQDTSSVVGAASKYGTEALQVATTVKLTRALWIIPISLLSALAFNTKGTRIKIPYFIGLFVLAIILNSYIPFFQEIGTYVVHISKVGLTLTLFLIGASLSRDVLLSVGYKAILQGLVLWLCLAIPVLIYIYFCL